MARPRKKDPDTGEVIVGRDTEKPILPGNSTGYLNPSEKKLYLQKAEAQLEWQRKKNQKITLELKEKQGGLVDFDLIKRQVLQCNQMVKQQVLAVIERANLPREARLLLRKQMVNALNELAYEQEQLSPE